MNASALEKNQREYARLRQHWIDTLSGDHRNAVWRQMAEMINEEIWFKTIIALRKKKKSPPVNAHVFDMIITGYGVKQSLAIRRLTDDNPKTASLVNVVNKIRKNVYLLNRAVVVGHDGTPMDLAELQSALTEGITYDEHGVGIVDLKRMQAWSDAEHKHKAFDRLRDSPLDDEPRADDIISEKVLGRLNKALHKSAFRRVRDQCDKYLAHADLGDLSDLKNPTYTDIRTCIKTLVEVREFLRADFLQSSGGSVVATYQGDHFRHLSEPLVPIMGKKIYRKIWDKYVDEIEAWGKIKSFRRYAIHQE